MNKIIKKILAPFVLLSLAAGVGLSVSITKEPVEVKAATTDGSEWKRVNSLADLTSGDWYVFMGEAATKNVMSVSRGKDFQERFLLPNNTNANDLGTNTIDDQAIVWTLTGSGSSFKINSVKDGASGYLYYSGSSNAVNYGNIQQDWTFTYSSGLFVITTPGGRKLQYNSSAPRFATYSSGQKDIALYKYTVFSSPLVSLSYEGTPITDYYEGDSFDPTGLTFTAHFEDTSSVDVTGSVSFSPDPLTVGTTKVTASYTVGGITKSIDITGLNVTVNPFQLVGSYEFGASGHTSWPISTGMGTYFGSGYGVSNASSGGTVKAARLLKDVPVASTIRVTIESITNDATNTTDVSVYGLNYNGERITGVSGTYTNPTNGGISDFDALRNRAAEFPGEFTFAPPVDVKIYGLEVVFASSAKRSLLCKITVKRALGTDAEQAAAFVKLVNSDVGSSANGKCVDVLATLQNDYTILSAGAKAIYEGASDADSIAAKQRIAYLQAWVAAHTPSGSRYIENSSATIINVALIGALGLTAIFGFYFLTKKKKQV